MRASARWRRFFPCRKAAPYSVTTYWTSAREVTTPAPGFNCGTMRETVSFFVVEGNAMNALPPLEYAHPRTKSTCPPNPL